jgi:hypothetical protein
MTPPLRVEYIPEGDSGVHVSLITVDGATTGDVLTVIDTAGVKSVAPLPPSGGGGGPHASSHENGGLDEIDVSGLSGQLADPQIPDFHAADHENGGTDEIDVAGLSGLLADPQTPLPHSIGVHTDVDLTGLLDTQVLAYDAGSGKFEPRSLATGATGVRPLEYDQRRWFHQINAQAATYESYGPPTALSGVGGSSGSNADADGYWIGIQTTGVINNSSGIIPAVYSVGPTRDQEAVFVARIKTGTDITNVRYWVGLTGIDPRTSADPAGAHLASFRYDTSVDGTAFWRCCTKDGTTINVTASAVAIAVSTAYNLRIETNGTNVKFYINDVLVHTSTTNLPGASAAMSPNVSVTTLAAAIKNWKYSRQFGHFYDQP